MYSSIVSSLADLYDTVGVYIHYTGSAPGHESVSQGPRLHTSSRPLREGQADREERCAVRFKIREKGRVRDQRRVQMLQNLGSQRLHTSNNLGPEGGAERCPLF